MRTMLDIRQPGRTVWRVGVAYISETIENSRSAVLDIGGTYE
jgi:hypothetical protein